jgi:hypothetical protein
MRTKSHSSVVPVRSRSSHRRRGQQRFNARVASDTDTSNEEYRVGPGRPPKEFQFKPGQSGNPKGAKRKTKSIAPDLKALLERALNEKVKFGRREREQTITKAAAGIAKLVNQFAGGDRLPLRTPARTRQTQFSSRIQGSEPPLRRSSRRAACQPSR